MPSAKPITVSIPQATAAALLVALLGVGGGEAVRRASATAAEPSEVQALRTDVAELAGSVDRLGHAVDGLRYDVGLICQSSQLPCQSRGQP